MSKIVAFLAPMAVFLSAVAGNAVGFVNVGHAVDGALLRETVTNGVAGIIAINYELAAQEAFDVGSAVAEAAKGHPQGGGRILNVYFVDTPSMPPQVVVPGFFAVMNLRGIGRGADRRTYERRVLKMALKGLAFACGVGANQDAGRCVMGAGSFETLKGIDSTSATYSPFAHFLVSDYLQARGLLDETPPKFN